MLGAEEAINKFLEFERRANAKRSKQIDRIKDDRTFLSGKQWETEDDTIFDPSIPRRTVNVLANSINSTTNVYASYPYKWYSQDQNVDQAAEEFLKQGSNSRAPYDALYQNVAFGLSYMALGSETILDSNGESVDVPALYCVDKQENVYYDPDSVEMDGRDAIEAAIIETKSKNWVRAKYGDEWVTEKGVRPLVNVQANKDPDTMVFVTYFRVEDGHCNVYRLLNDNFIDDPVTLEIDRVPVFPVYGERSWVDDEVVWQGLVRKGAAIQKLLNYSFTQLSARMAQAPKPGILAVGDAIEGYYDGYRNFTRNTNPLLVYKNRTDDGKRELPAPIRFDNTVKFDDITGIIGSQLELLSTITGVDAKGLMNGDQPQVTATEVMYNERQTQTTIRHYYANLKDTMKAIGETVMQLLGFGRVNIDVIQGPADAMQLQVARQELMNLMNVVPEDKRMSFVNGIFLSHPENAVLRNVFSAINMQPGPSPIEMQQQDVIEQMKQAIGQRDQQIAELQQEIDDYRRRSENNDKSHLFDLEKLKLQHQYSMEDEVLKAQLDSGLNANKSMVDARKQEMELEKQAIQLDSARTKARADEVRAQAEIVKASQPVKLSKGDV